MSGPGTIAADTAVRAAGADLQAGPAGAATLRLSGRWRIADGLPSVQAVLDGLGDRRELRVDGSTLEGWELRGCSPTSTASSGRSPPGTPSWWMRACRRACGGC